MIFTKIGYYLTSERDGMKFKIEYLGKENEKDVFKIHIEKGHLKKWVYPYHSLELAKLDCENLSI